MTWEDRLQIDEHEARLHNPRLPERIGEHRLLALLETHGAREGSFLDSYRELAERPTTSEAARFLVQLILEDERRHHETFDHMANGLRSSLWETEVEPHTPRWAPSDDPELLAATKRLLDLERADAKELRHLRKSLHAAASPLDPLLVELMRLDTAKHIAILRFLRDRLSAD